MSEEAAARPSAAGAAAAQGPQGPQIPSPSPRREFPIRLKLVVNKRPAEAPPATATAAEPPAATPRHEAVVTWHPARSQWCREDDEGSLRSLFVTVTAGDASHARLRPPGRCWAAPAPDWDRYCAGKAHTARISNRF